jgi:hypothetical protein
MARGPRNHGTMARVVEFRSRRHGQNLVGRADGRTRSQPPDVMSAQQQNVRYWPKADIMLAPTNVGFGGKSRHMSAYDPKRTSIPLRAVPHTCRLITANLISCSSVLTAGDRMQFDQLRRRGCHHAFWAAAPCCPLGTGTQPTRRKSNAGHSSSRVAIRPAVIDSVQQLAT